MELIEVRITVRKNEVEELAKALRVLLERSWPEVVVSVGK